MNWQDAGPALTVVAGAVVGRWTHARVRWLEEQTFELPLQQLVFQEYVDAAIAAGKRTEALVAEMHEML